MRESLESIGSEQGVLAIDGRTRGALILGGLGRTVGDGGVVAVLEGAGVVGVDNFDSVRDVEITELSEDLDECFLALDSGAIGGAGGGGALTTGGGNDDPFRQGGCLVVPAP